MTPTMDQIDRLHARNVMHERLRNLRRAMAAVSVEAAAVIEYENEGAELTLSLDDKAQLAEIIEQLHTIYLAGHPR